MNKTQQIGDLTFHPPPSTFHRILLAFASAFLQVAAFPNINQPWCAWVALVPWLILLRGLTPREAFRWSWLVGALFFLGSMWWLVHVTVFGWLILCAYLALFFGVFGWAVCCACGDTLHVTRDKKTPPVTCHLSPVIGVFFIPALWTALEYARSHLLSGLGWNLLAYSQTPWTEVIQLAALTGAWGVSFLIVMANVGIARAIACWTQDSRRKTRAAAGQPESRVSNLVSSIAAPAGILALSLMYGARSLGRSPATAPPVRVAVMQGNVPQEQKWDETYQETILQRYEALTRQAAATNPDLIVWPETSVPGYFGVEEELTQRVLHLAAEVKRPLLVGSPAPRWTPDGFIFMNRASLISADGAILQEYDKLHLVPYGEFIPGDRWLPWLRKILPPIGDFAPGKEHAVFEVPVSGFPFPVSRSPFSVGTGNEKRQTENEKLQFSVLICFEDVFPELAREFVRRGARMLAVITNDAWFGPTAAAYQHAQTSAFRAVELGVPVVRAANTGWSGCIDARGRWQESVHDASGRELFVEGMAVCRVPLGDGRTLYARWGDWFAWACLAAALAGALPAIISAFRARRSVRGRA